MIKYTKTILAAALVMSSVQLAHAAIDLNAVSIQDVGYAGNGCPSGSASVVISDDRKSVSVLFDSYIAEAGGEGQSTFARKKCDIAFGLNVPEGISVSLFDADYRGFTDLPRGARADFTRDYFFAGSNGPSLSNRWTGARSDSFLINDKLDVIANVWSACGADVILRSKTATTLRTPRGHEAIVMVDSVDMRTTTKALFKYNFRYRACNK